MRQVNGRRRGTLALTLVEMVVALVLAGVVMGTLWRMLVEGRRFYRAQASAAEVQRALRDVGEVLAGELEPLDATAGDLVALGPDSLSVRAQRSIGFVCAPPDPASGRVVVLDSLLFGYRAVDPARDRALVFSEGDPATPDDDAWLDFGVTSVSAAALCDGRAGTGLTLQGATARLAGVAVGSPLRTYERVVYRSYRDDDGAWWLGQRALSGGAWAAISPVAGPLASGTGLACRGLDAAGNAAGTLAGVARVECDVRSVSATVLQLAGGNQRRYADSLRVGAALRNGRRGGGP